jgi:hypothetical protein
MILGTSPRSYLSDPALNAERYTYSEYHNDPDVMLDVQLKFQDFKRHNIYADHEMGLPEEWFFFIDGGNFSHSAWYGCDINFASPDSPDTKPLLGEDNKNMLFDRGIPDPFSGVYGRQKRMYEYLQKKLASYTYRGIPVNRSFGAPASNVMGDGIPFTTACKLRGTTRMCLDMVDDPEYADRLLLFITEAIIHRTKAWLEYLGKPVRNDNVLLGDDSVVLLSPEMYRQRVLPLHRRIYETFGTSGCHRAIHLCGAAGRHLPVVHEELGVNEFDTGFPLDLVELYETVGEEVIVKGGVRVEILRSGTPEEIDTESRKILSATKRFKRFIFRDANLLAPCTPLENLRAMYSACKRYGRYRSS